MTTRGLSVVAVGTWLCWCPCCCLGANTPFCLCSASTSVMLEAACRVGLGSEAGACPACIISLFLCPKQKTCIRSWRLCKSMGAPGGCDLRSVAVAVPMYMHKGTLISVPLTMLESLLQGTTISFYFFPFHQWLVRAATSVPVCGHVMYSVCCLLSFFQNKKGDSFDSLMP